MAERRHLDKNYSLAPIHIRSETGRVCPMGPDASKLVADSLCLITFEVRIYIWRQNYTDIAVDQALLY